MGNLFGRLGQRRWNNVRGNGGNNNLQGGAGGGGNPAAVVPVPVPPQAQAAQEQEDPFAIAEREEERERRAQAYLAAEERALGLQRLADRIRRRELGAVGGALLRGWNTAAQENRIEEPEALPPEEDYFTKGSAYKDMRREPGRRRWDDDDNGLI
jgi:hypothetical protein